MDERARQEAEENWYLDLKNLEALESRYSETKNPLYVWNAITVLNHLRSLPQSGLKLPDLPPIPEWIFTYLAEAAIKLTKLADRETEDGAGSPVGQILHMLGFKKNIPGLNGKRKGGTNIFVEYRAARRDLDVSNIIEESRHVGRAPAQTKEMVRQRLGEKEASVIRRRKTAGKKLRNRMLTHLNETTTE